MSDPVLYVGNKNYSSWSLRPWLALRWGGVRFEEQVIPLGGEGYGKSRIPAVRAVSPSGRVPALRIGDVVVHESLAICEWAAEQAPSLWPGDPMQRAVARALACEMHAGFGALRRDLTMNVRRRLDREPAWPDDTRADLDRTFEVWTTTRARYGGEGAFLFGARGVVDAMFAPVATRLRTYAVAMPDAVAAYVAAVLDDADMRAWERDAVAEAWTIPSADALYR
jgi:glutathione S-transferase